MRDAMVVVICNLKAKKLASYPSHGMVICASTKDGDKIEILQPPEGSQVGDIIEFDGIKRQPPEVLKTKKKNNPFSKVFSSVHTDAHCQALYRTDDGRSLFFKTENGICKSSTIKNGNIS